MAYPHWEYLLALDVDLEACARYVELCDANFDTYSIEFVRLLLASGSEIDVVAKSLCKRITPSGTFRDIKDYRDGIRKQYPRFHEMKITVPRYGLTFRPWEAWSEEANPPWWRSYNNVKHKRDSCYAEANLKNTIASVAALFALVLYYYQPELYAHQLLPWPRLLALHTDHYHDFRMVGDYNLPDFGSSDTGSPPVHALR